jgi:hypothetical protein
MEIITKLSEYISYIENLPKEFSLSRGQFRDHQLLPGALRKDKAQKRKYSKRVIRDFLEKFKIDAHQYISSPGDIKNEVEWMLYAQHYGLPTKLLDFTTSHITSILFAVEKSFQNEITENAVVYFLNPLALNHKFKQQSKIINISDIKDNTIIEQDGPIVINGRKLNTRINAQKGLFVLFQDEDNSLEKINDESILRKIEICKEDMTNILSSLYVMGISFTHLYPELESVTKDIVTQQNITEFLKDND